MEYKNEVRRIIRQLLYEGVVELQDGEIPILTPGNETNLEEKALTEKPAWQGVDKVFEKINEKLK